MSEPICGVDGCAQPTHTGGYVCAEHTGELVRDLRAVPQLAAALRETYTRTTRYGSGNDGRRSADRPLPFDERVRPAAWSLMACLVGWVRIVETERSVPYTGRDSAAAAATWLVDHVPWLMQHAHGVEAFDEITDEVRQVARLVDRPTDRWYAGPCQEPTVDGTCEQELWVRPGVMTICCRHCQAQHDVAERREWLLEAAEEHLANATTIARAFTALATPVTEERIRQWKARARLVPRGIDHRGRPLYRVGDVRELLMQDMERSAKRRAKGSA